MPPPKQKRRKEKSELHPRNPHRERYDFQLLAASFPALAPFVRPNPYNDLSIDFSDPEAVKMLNTALLKQYYGVDQWDIPSGYLCPPIPGRADYLHHISDVLAADHGGKIPTGPSVRCLDIGVGANCVYPIIGNKTFGWSFVGTDIDPVSIESANRILATNPSLQASVECRLQTNPNHIFQGIIRPGEVFDLTICNPPFYTTKAAAEAQTLRKRSNLGLEQTPAATRNFGGQQGELWRLGGEEKFVQDMIRESTRFARSCCWFSSLVSNHDHLKSIYKFLDKAAAVEVKTIPMGQGNKVSRIVAWSFLTEEERGKWRGSAFLGAHITARLVKSG